jgi:pimeloyl-ACP methyl ester carboxylesterase
MQSQLSEMRVPTLVVNGEFDGSLTSGKETAARIPGARHAVIKGAGHCCNLEDPTAFDEVVIPFLADRGLWRGPVNSTAEP